MDPSIKDLLRAGAERTDLALERLLPSPDTAPHSLHRAMRHSVFAGGKRLRPILCFEAWRLASSLSISDSHPHWQDASAAASLGAALEMLHTYSLIHDDLPALDNDDLRRGQPTCHKVFGEAIAILAGDALQTLAFHTIAHLPCPATTTVSILGEVATAVGTGVGTSPLSNVTEPLAPAAEQRVGFLPGMVGGQVLDLESEGQVPTADLVEQIHRSKTGALITVSIVAGGHLAQASHDTIQRLRTFGENAGLAFQIVDDVLDITEASEQLGKTAGKDTASTKATWPSVYTPIYGPAESIARSLADAQNLIRDAFAALDPLGPSANHLRSLAQYLVDRKK